MKEGSMIDQIAPLLISIRDEIARLNTRVSEISKKLDDASPPTSAPAPSTPTTRG
jgi:hypothetical protein